MRRTILSVLSMTLAMPLAQAADEAAAGVSRIDALGGGLHALWREASRDAVPAEWDFLSRRSLIDDGDVVFAPAAGLRNGGLGVAPAMSLSRSNVALGAGAGFGAHVSTAQAALRGGLDQAQPNWWSSAASYQRGAWRAFASLERGQDWLVPGARDQGLRFGAAYRYADVQLSAGWERMSRDAELGDAAQQAWWIGLAQRVGDGAVKLNYARALDATGGVTGPGSAHQFALGYERGLSPQTAIYAFYTRLSNDPNALFQLGGGEVDNGLMGLGRGGISLGIRHNF